MKKNNKATMDKLNGLHDMAADYYRECLESDQELSSGTLAAINSFLKMNSITADVVESSPMQNLTLRIQDIIKEEEVG